jgi:protein-S-isoprenylcysteine O-methyltransferase Ste14
VSVWRHVRAIGLLPFMATVVVPALVLWGTELDVGWGAIPGAVLIGIGLLLFVRTVALFASVGEGTLAPWDPTERLVVVGPFRHVRNPMISGVGFVLLGEAATFGSLGILIWFAAFAAANAIWMPLVEEPGLRRRFGEDYERYCEHVPRWLPRLRPWDPGSEPRKK